jgi:hypothetical protein
MGYLEKRLYKLLGEEIEGRGFRRVERYQEEMVPEMPNGFSDRKEAIDYLEDLTANYKVVAFKNLIFYAGECADRVVAVVEILVGSQTREILPVINIHAWKDEKRLYTYKNLSHSFVRALDRERDEKKAVDVFFEDIKDMVWIFQRDVAQWICTGKWPKENFITDIKLNY